MLLEVDRPVTFFARTFPVPEPLTLHPGQVNEVADDLLANLPDRQSEIFARYVEAGIITDVTAARANALVEGKAQFKEPDLEPAAADAIASVKKGSAQR